MKPQITLATCIAMALLINPVSAQDSSFNLEDLTCFDVVSLPEEDSLFVTALLIGFTNGKASAAETSADAIRATVEAFDAACAEAPDMRAIDALS